jgi:hypothetical protein
MTPGNMVINLQENHHKIEKISPQCKHTEMERYCTCYKKRRIKPEFIDGTPVEILSPVYKHLHPLPTTKEELEVLDFETIEQLHLLQAEYNKRFQEARYYISKNDMQKGIHYMRCSNELKLRMIELEKRHSDIQTALEPIRLPIQPLKIKIPK